MNTPSINERYGACNITREIEAHVELYELDGIWRGPARVEMTGPRRFAFREDGSPALVIPVVEGGEVIDAVAVSSKFSRCLLRLDDATMLGGDNLDRARIEGRKPVLVATPAAWLMRPDATCILDMKRDGATELTGFAHVACADEPLAHVVHAALTRPRPMPRLWVTAHG